MRPALSRMAGRMFGGWDELANPQRYTREQARRGMDAQPPGRGMRAERPWVSPGRPPWVRRDAGRFIDRVLDDIADRIAPPTRARLRFPPPVRAADEDDDE